jgi:Halocarboxylic acid dehydrogenase DehI
MMEATRSGDLERGMDLLARLPEVMPDEADPYVRLIYEDIRNTLRVPFVNTIFRVLANYPTYLSFVWSQLGPYLRKRAMEHAADELRTGNMLGPLLEEVQAPAPANWAELGDLERIRPFTDAMHYVAPKLLLVATAFDDELLDRDASDTPDRSDEGASIPLGWIPIGPAEGMISLPLIAPHQATAQVQTLFAAITRRHGHPLVATYYRALANWPPFLRVVWDYLEPLVGSAAYARHKEDVINRALHVVRRLSRPRMGTVAAFGVTEAELADIRAILAVFRLRLIPDLLLDVTLVKASPRRWGEHARV